MSSSTTTNRSRKQTKQSSKQQSSSSQSSTTTSTLIHAVGVGSNYFRTFGTISSKISVEESTPTSSSSSSDSTTISLTESEEGSSSSSSSGTHDACTFPLFPTPPSSSSSSSSLGYAKGLFSPFCMTSSLGISSSSSDKKSLKKNSDKKQDGTDAEGDDEEQQQQRFGTRDLKQIVCGATHTAILSKSGEVYTMGTMHGFVTPSPTLCVTRLPLKCIALSHGRRHVLALMEGGAVVMSWGAGHFGQLGHGGEVTGVQSPRIIERLLPQLVGGRVTSIAAGGLHSAALVDIGGGKTRAFSWGFNRRGQCGTEGGKCNTVPYPMPITNVTMTHPQQQQNETKSSSSSSEHKDSSSGSKEIDQSADQSSSGVSMVEPQGRTVYFQQLSLGRLHSVALSTDGHVYCWGATTGGRCGLGEHSHSSSSITLPRRVEALKEVEIKSIAVGDRHNLALSESGRVYSWGMGGEGQLGHGHTMHLYTPRIICDLDLKHLHQVHSSTDHHQMETTNTTNHNKNNYQVTSIYASGCYSAALTNTGDMFTWGYGDAGNLGHDLPQQNCPTLPKVEPGPMSKTGAGVRVRDTRSFDSKLNTLLPRRIVFTRDCGLNVIDAALGPVHMILLCEKRSKPTTTTTTKEDGEEETTVCEEEEEEDIVPKTLYELEQGKRSKGLARLRAMGIERAHQSNNPPSGSSESMSKPSSPNTKDNLSSSKAQQQQPRTKMSLLSMPNKTKEVSSHPNSTISITDAPSQQNTNQATSPTMGTHPIQDPVVPFPSNPPPPNITPFKDEDQQQQEQPNPPPPQQQTKRGKSFRIKGRGSASSSGNSAASASAAAPKEQGRNSLLRLNMARKVLNAKLRLTPQTNNDGGGGGEDSGVSERKGRIWGGGGRG